MKAVKKAFAFYDKIMKKYDPIISKVYLQMYFLHR